MIMVIEWSGFSIQRPDQYDEKASAILSWLAEHNYKFYALERELQKIDFSVPGKDFKGQKPDLESC